MILRYVHFLYCVMLLMRSAAVEWHDLRVLELEGTGWAVILGHKRREVRDSPPPLPMSPSPSSSTEAASSLELYVTGDGLT